MHKWENVDYSCISITVAVNIKNYIVWGLTVENESHCDFTKLREMLIRTNMEDMREVTHMRHYELYRKKILETVSRFFVYIV